MARVTVEDCILKVPNRFELVMLAAQRARNLHAGEAPTVDRDNDKNPVIALREIAAGTIDLEAVRHDLMERLSGLPKPEPVSEEVQDLLPTESNIFAGLDISPEEQAAEEQAAAEEDIEAAIARELGG